MMKALLKYPGSKWNIAPWIIQHFPEHKVYVEPFFGSGAIFFTKAPSYIEVINDINGDVVNIFRVCRERPADLARVLELTPYAREEFNDCVKIEGDELERARRMVVRYHQSFAGANTSVNSWKNSQTGKSPRNPQLWQDLPQIVYEVCDRLREAHIENRNALELIQRYNNPEVLLYLDPPYLLNLRKRNIYKNEMTDDQHRELLDLIRASKAQIILSAYDNELYNTELKDWYTADKVTTAQFGIHRTEKLYMNFCPGLLTFMHDSEAAKI